MKAKILIVEDDSLLIKMYQTKFVNEGYEVLVAGDGEQGLKLIRENLPQFVILDFMMPKLSGMGLLELLHADPALSQIPVMMLSNMSQPSEIEKAKTLGAKEFLLKANYTPGQIVEIVKKYLK
jgi:two-component system, OmpR family, alkaline phosphatase synthesis response regulator PhoP